MEDFTGKIINGLKIVTDKKLYSNGQRKLSYLCPLCNNEIESNIKSITINKSNCCKKCCYIHQAENCRKGSVLPLMENSPESYYYQGLLLADGNFSKQNGRDIISTIVISLCELDKKYLIKFADFLGTGYTTSKRNGSTRQYRVGISDKINVPILCESLGVGCRKTYNPPNPIIYQSMDSLRRLSICCGMIDGDGTRCPGSRSFMIGIHPSWESVIGSIFEGLYTSIKIRSGVCWCRIGTSGHNILQEHRKLYRLPVFERKWY